MDDELGLIHVYTGEGKGKTTAALGLALRSWGHGYRVCIIQFMKCGETYGEVMALRKLEGIDLFQFGADHLIMKGQVVPEDVKLAQRALSFAREILNSNDYDIVILDEVNVAMYFDLISPEDVLAVLKERRPGIEVILTGRNAPESILKKADVITRMNAVKHPYDDGWMARKGIEF